MRLYLRGPVPNLAGHAAFQRRGAGTVAKQPVKNPHEVPLARGGLKSITESFAVDDPSRVPWTTWPASRLSAVRAMCLHATYMGLFAATAPCMHACLAWHGMATAAGVFNARPQMCPGPCMPTHYYSTIAS
jgi:hypothetical protein